MERRSTALSVLVYAAALLLTVVILAPLVWLFLMSISSAADLSARPLHWWPEAVAHFSRRTWTKASACGRSCRPGPPSM